MNTLTWYGHATLGLKTSDSQLIIDPFFSGNPAASTTADNVDADYILISHGHGDHIGDAMDIARRTEAKVIANAEIANWIKTQDYENVHARAPGRWLQPSLWLPQADPGTPWFTNARWLLRRQPLRLFTDL